MRPSCQKGRDTISKESEAIERIMKGLKCSEEEAKEVYLADKAIDKGEKTDFDLSKEQEAIAKKYRMTGTREIEPKMPTLYKFEKKGRTRKENPIKRLIISVIAEVLAEREDFTVENLEIVNPECEVDFDIQGDSYYIKLSKRTKPKK